MAGAHAQTVSPSSNVLLDNQGGSALSQPILSSLAARRSQFGVVNMLAGFSNNPLLNGALNPGLTGMTGTATSGLSVGGGTSFITVSNSDFPDLQRSMPVASESTGLAGMGLPTSPVSISSNIVNSMVNQQGNSPLSRLEQQDLLLQQQQVRSATPPLLATAHLSQSVHQDRVVQASQQLAAGHQAAAAAFSGQTSGSGSQLLGAAGSQQALGVGSQQTNGLGQGSSLQQVKAGGISPQQALSAVKAEPQSLAHSLQQQQQQQQRLLIPKMEVKSEIDLDQKVGQHALQRSTNSIGLTSDLQLQEALQRQQAKHMQAQLSALQQQRLLQGLPQQQHLHDPTSMQLQQLQQHHHQQLQLQQQQASFLQCAGVRKHSDFEAGVCVRRLMQYLYHQRHRPPDNNIAFWRNFVGKYFAPNAKKRWCVSLYGSGGRQPTGIFPQDVWHCEICGTNPGRGFETTVEVLPRLSKIKFDSGIQEELLFVDLPHEYRQASGHMVLEYGKAIQESVFEQLRVVREGQLRIVFSPELKILSWEFCARSHEELLPRRLIIPQVNQLAHISQKYQNAQSGEAGVSAQDLQTNCHLFVTSARQLAKNLELPTVNDLGYTKRYVRCLQISEVVNSMKDLIDFSRDNSFGPTASLHKFPRRSDGSSRSMLRNAQIRALQEQQQQQQQQVQQRQQQEQQQRQQAQQQQEEEQQPDDLDLHSLLADTNTPALSGLQQQFDEATNQLETQTADVLDEVISAPSEADPLSSFFQSNSLAALQTSLHDTLLSPVNVPHQTNVQNPLGTTVHTQQQQQLSAGRAGALSGSLQASPTNSLSLQNSFPSISGQSPNPYARGDSSSQQNMAGASASLLQQQPQSHGNASNVVHHLLQEMMINQQLNHNHNHNHHHNNTSLHQTLGVSGINSGLSGNLACNLGGNLGGNMGLNGGGQSGMLGLNSNGLGNNQLGANNSINSLGNSGIGGIGSSNVALSALANHHNLRGMGGGGGGGLGGLSGLMGNMNAHNARLNLAAAVAQQQQNQLHELGHQSLHHDLGGNNNTMLGGLGMTGSFGGLFN